LVKERPKVLVVTMDTLYQVTKVPGKLMHMAEDSLANSLSLHEVPA